MARRKTSGNGPQEAVSAGPADGHSGPKSPFTIRLRGNVWTVRHTPFPLLFERAYCGCLVDPVDRDILVSTAWGAELAVRLTAIAMARAAKHGVGSSPSKGERGPMKPRRQPDNYERVKVGRQTWRIRSMPLQIWTKCEDGTASDWDVLVDPKAHDVLVSTSQGAACGVCFAAVAMAGIANEQLQKKKRKR